MIVTGVSIDPLPGGDIMWWRTKVFLQSFYITFSLEVGLHDAFIVLTVKYVHNLVLFVFVRHDDATHDFNIWRHNAVLNVVFKRYNMTSMLGEIHLCGLSLRWVNCLFLSLAFSFRKKNQSFYVFCNYFPIFRFPLVVKMKPDLRLG